MTAKLKQLVTKSTESNKLCIEVLEDALQMAKDGKILCVGIAAAITEGELYTDFAGGTNAANLGCAISVLQKRHIEWLVE